MWPLFISCYISWQWITSWSHTPPRSGGQPKQWCGHSADSRRQLSIFVVWVCVVIRPRENWRQQAATHHEVSLDQHITGQHTRVSIGELGESDHWPTNHSNLQQSRVRDSKEWPDHQATLLSLWLEGVVTSGFLLRWNFFRTICPGCQRSTGHLQFLQDNFSWTINWNLKVRLIVVRKHSTLMTKSGNVLHRQFIVNTTNVMSRGFDHQLPLLLKWINFDPIVDK